MVRPPNPTPCNTMRAYAALCFARTGSAAAAAAEFNAAFPGQVRQAKKFCKKWHRRLVETGSVEDGHRRGRPTKVGDADARRAAALLMRGAGTGNPADGYNTLQDAVQGCPELAAIAERCQCTLRTLLRRMREVEPNLVQRAVRFRPPLSTKNRKLPIWPAPPIFTSMQGGSCRVAQDRSSIAAGTSQPPSSQEVPKLAQQERLQKHASPRQPGQLCLSWF